MPQIVYIIFFLTMIMTPANQVAAQNLSPVTLQEGLKIAGEAKNMQEKQERMSKEQLDVLKKISTQLDAVIVLLQNRGNNK